MCEWYNSPIVDAQGNVLCVASLVLDITERTSVEEELKIYQVMIESAQDAIFYKDLESRYISANDKTLEELGLPREKVIGKNDIELMANQEEARGNLRDDQTVFKSGKTTEFYKQVTGKDDKEYWFQAKKVPQFDNDGKVKGLVGIARDFTDLKEWKTHCASRRRNYVPYSQACRMWSSC